MDFSTQVSLMSLAMFLGTFLLGWTPKMLKASDRVMNLISVFGAGMLVGAALIVVIPEAIKVIKSLFRCDYSDLGMRTYVLM